MSGHTVYIFMLYHPHYWSKGKETNPCRYIKLNIGCAFVVHKIIADGHICGLKGLSHVTGQQFSPQRQHDTWHYGAKKLSSL